MKKGLFKIKLLGRGACLLLGRLLLFGLLSVALGASPATLGQMQTFVYAPSTYSAATYTQDLGYDSHQLSPVAPPITLNVNFESGALMAPYYVYQPHPGYFTGGLFGGRSSVSAAEGPRAPPVVEYLAPVPNFNDETAPLRALPQDVDRTSSLVTAANQGHPERALPLAQGLLGAIHGAHRDAGISQQAWFFGTDEYELTPSEASDLAVFVEQRIKACGEVGATVYMLGFASQHSKHGVSYGARHNHELAQCRSRAAKASLQAGLKATYPDARVIAVSMHPYQVLGMGIDPATAKEMLGSDDFKGEGTNSIRANQAVVVIVRCHGSKVSMRRRKRAPIARRRRRSGQGTASRVIAAAGVALACAACAAEHTDPGAGTQGAPSSSQVASADAQSTGTEAATAAGAPGASGQPSASGVTPAVSCSASGTTAERLQCIDTLCRQWRAQSLKPPPASPGDDALLSGVCTGLGRAYYMRGEDLLKAGSAAGDALEWWRRAVEVTRAGTDVARRAQIRVGANTAASNRAFSECAFVAAISKEIYCEERFGQYLRDVDREACKGERTCEKPKALDKLKIDEIDKSALEGLSKLFCAPSASASERALVKRLPAFVLPDACRARQAP